MLSLPAALIALAITGSGAGDTVLLDFYADWCSPCQAMNPTVEQLAAKGYPVRRVNIDQYRDLAQRFGVRNIPCFVMIVNGKEAGRVVGPTGLARLEQLCSLGRAPASPGSMLATPASPPRPTDSGPARTALASAAQLPPVADSVLLAASVRIRVEDARGHSCGSGTIIDCRSGGEALVLTCGHLFRDSQGQGKIEIDVFGSSPGTRLPARLISYDLERDVGLIAFRPQGPVTVARVAPAGYGVRRGDAVASVGCNNGEDPTVQRSRVNAIDRFLDPSEQRRGSAPSQPHEPWNLQVAGQPVVGRSGGGLFSAEGMVIGVCNAAEPVDQEGLFAALGSIHAALDQQGLTSLYHQPLAGPTLIAATTSPATDPRNLAAATDPFAGRNREPPVRVPSPEPPAAVVAASTATASQNSPGNGPLPAGEQNVMDEIRRRVREGAEVVCIIRDRQDPQSKSEVITLNRASAGFVDQLSRAGESAGVPQPTSLEVPRRRMPILEWDVGAGYRHDHPLPR